MCIRDSPGDLRQSFAAMARVLDDLPAHAWIPVTSQVIRDILRGLSGLFSDKEGGDLVHHFDEMVGVHERQPRKRCGCAYTTCRSARAKPMSVTPVSTAISPPLIH